jgi:acyl-CoA synthetase (AMP-forming)/AMP-acid ligase II
MIIVSENCIALAGLLLAASRINAWAIVANPRLSAREIDQVRQHGISPASTAITSTSSRPAKGRRKSSLLMRCLRPRPERFSSISSPNR